MAARAGGRSDTRLIVAMIASTVLVLVVVIGGTLLLERLRAPEADDRNLETRVQNTIVYSDADSGETFTYSLQGSWEQWTGAIDAGAAEAWVGTYASGEDQVVYEVARFDTIDAAGSYAQSLVTQAEADGGTVRSSSDTNTDGTGTLWVVDTGDAESPVSYVWDDGRGLALTMTGDEWSVYRMYAGHDL
jgi:hypothetical protein